MSRKHTKFGQFHMSHWNHDRCRHKIAGDVVSCSMWQDTQRSMERNSVNAYHVYSTQDPFPLPRSHSAHSPVPLFPHSFPSDVVALLIGPSRSRQY